jgi:hypothetical protein
MTSLPKIAKHSAASDSPVAGLVRKQLLEILDKLDVEANVAGVDCGINAALARPR